VECSHRTRNAIRADISDIRALRHLSARIGRDPLLVQASSGNTSLKLDGSLWIKASGTWLASADQQDILVAVRLSECLDCLKEGRSLPKCKESSRAQWLRPSIETFMHAVLPQPFAIHVHSIDALAWAVRSDAEARLAERLSVLAWKWIPYVPSGLPLAREVQMASSTCPHADVFILGNHGVVVCGESCDATESLLSEVQRRLSIRPRPAAEPNFGLLERLHGLSSWRLPGVQALHTVGTDAISRRIAKGGILYPCQAIFVGRTVTSLPAHENASDVTSRIHQLDSSCPFVIVEGSGILINKNITAAEYAVLNGFVEMLRRIEPSAPIRYLTDREVNNILNADAHRYRMSAANSAHVSSCHAAGFGHF